MSEADPPAEASGRLACGDGLLVELEVLVGAVQVPATRLAGDAQVWRWLAALDADDTACLAVAAARRLASEEDGFGVAAGCVDHFLERPPALDLGGVRLLVGFDALPNRGHAARTRVMDLALTALGTLVVAGAPGAAALAREVADQLVGWNPEPFVNLQRRLPTRVGELRDRALALTGRRREIPVEVGPILRMDGFGVAAVARLGDSPAGWPPGVADLLGHCATARSARPSNRWSQQCRVLLGAAPAGEQVVADLLRLVADTEPVTFMTDHGPHRRLLTSWNDDLVRGLVWTAGVIEPPWLAGVLEAVGRRCLAGAAGRTVRLPEVSGEKVPYACFGVLAAAGDVAALRALDRLSAATANRSVAKRLRSELGALAERTGVPVDDLLAGARPDWGLDAAGRVVVGGGTAVLCLDDTAGAVVRWVAGGRESPRPPDGLDATVATEVERQRAALRRDAVAERRRLEALLVEGREWSWSDLASRVLERPLPGWFARRLLWSVESGSGDPVVGLPVPGDPLRLETPTGTVEVPEAATAVLWHPVGSGAGELNGLRRLLAERGVAQPFAQAWRRTYRPTPEEAGLTSTGRVAGRAMRARALYGHARALGWWGAFLSGAWDGGERAVARRDFPAAGVRAEWDLGYPDRLSVPDRVEVAVAGALRFVLLDGTDPDPLPLGQVAGVAFSEAVREVELLADANDADADADANDLDADGLDADGLDADDVDTREAEGPPPAG